MLEAATAIMVRPEWRTVPCNISPRSERIPRPSLKSRSTTSLGSTASDFLVDSVLHNVKNLYTQNLLSQVAFVVDKMGLRTVPASLVSFCGKAIAFAFFYCDGVAEILVRLWKNSPRVLQRILSVHNVARSGRLKGTSDKINSTFPIHLHSLAFYSLASAKRHLRSRPHLPLATGYIPWHGPWLARWCGQDTDLFFCFVKNWFELYGSHVHVDLPPEERVCAPGYLVVLAQLFVNMEATVKKTGDTVPGNPGGAAAAPLGEILEDMNEPAAIVPTTPGYTYQPMAENRLIRLARDSLLGYSKLPPKSQTAFAKSFEALMKTCALSIAPNDATACASLCDFLEEGLEILDRYEQSIRSNGKILDWPFWISVCRAMIVSHNIMCEIRLFSFLHAMWTLLTREESRRRSLCLDWLLSGSIFDGFFNHWCPMVRAYFMRLLAWRIGRFSTASSLNM